MIEAGAVGLGWRRALASDLLRAPELVDFVEVIAENVRDSDAGSRTLRRELCALSRVWPVVPHGVTLSLGSVDGFDDDGARSLGRLARDLRAPFVSEHIAFVRAGDVEIGHLTALPRTTTAAAVVAANAKRAERLMGVPLVLENVAWGVRFGPDDQQLDEPAFIRAVLDMSGCGLLLDVANLYANAVNEGLDPFAVLDAYPLERTVMIHVAGSVVEDGFVFDTHAHAVPDVVLTLVERALARIGPRPLLLERDRGFDFADHARELAILRNISRRDRSIDSARCDVLVRERNVHALLHPHAIEGRRALGALQLRLARALNSDVDDPSIDLHFDARDLARSRAILARKRGEERAHNPPTLRARAVSFFTRSP